MKGQWTRMPRGAILLMVLPIPPPGGRKMADVSEYVADIKKYTAKVDEAAVAGMGKT